MTEQRLKTSCRGTKNGWRGRSLSAKQISPDALSPHLEADYRGLASTAKYDTTNASSLIMQVPCKLPASALPAPGHFCGQIFEILQPTQYRSELIRWQCGVLG
jgi:hypothetical protein